MRFQLVHYRIHMIVWLLTCNKWKNTSFILVLSWYVGHTWSLRELEPRRWAMKIQYVRAIRQQATCITRPSMLCWRKLQAVLPKWWLHLIMKTLSILRFEGLCNWIKLLTVFCFHHWYVWVKPGNYSDWLPGSAVRRCMALHINMHLHGVLDMAGGFDNYNRKIGIWNETSDPQDSYAYLIVTLKSS